MGTGLRALGEKQVNFSSNGGTNGLSGTQADPAVAALANGDFVVVYENPQTGMSLLAHFFDASGNAIGPPVSSAGFLNGVVDIDPAAHISVVPTVAATPDGGFLAAYADTSVEAQNPTTKVTFEANGIDVRRYDDTTGVSASFVIDAGGGPLHQPNVGTVGDVAIAAFADGTSLVAWDFDFNADPTDDDVYFAFLNASANGFTTINGAPLSPRPLTIANGFEGEPSVASSGNLAAVVYAADPGHKQGDQDIVLEGFNSSGTEVVAPVTVFGDSSLDVFSHPDVAALSDGRFVVVAEDDSTSKVVASVVDPVTRALTPLSAEFVGADPHVVGVPGGGFVLTFDNPAGDVVEARFGPGGSALFSAGVANAVTTGTQDENAIAANTSGTVFVAWRDESSSNPNSTDPDTRIEAQAFRALPLPQPNFNGDSFPDILWQNTSGQAAIWEMNGLNLIPADSQLAGANPGPNWKVVGGGDFNGDGRSDILWQNASGQAAIWEMNGAAPIAGGSQLVGPNPGPNWKAVATGDFNGDGRSDILWQNTSGQVAIWEMNGLSPIAGGSQLAGPNPGPNWKAVATGDFNGDGHSDILWQNASGQVAIWEMNGAALIAGGSQLVGPNPGPNWKAVATGDFNGDGFSDILLQNASGQVAIWEMNGAAPIAGGSQLVGPNPGPNWKAVGTGDFNGDGFSDILWQNASGQTAVWEMNETNVALSQLVGPNPGSSWHAVA